MPQSTQGMLVAGQQAGSVNEYNVAQALDRLKLDYSYQYSLDGGRFVRGGQVIDFLIWMPPRPMAVYVQSYWHLGQRGLEDELKQAAAERHGFEVVEVWDYETMTPEDALAAVKRKIL